jgi:hypothetical protein
MPSPNQLEQKFWKALKSDMTMMLGIDGVEDGHARPMTAQLDGEGGPIWFSLRRTLLSYKICRMGRVPLPLSPLKVTIFSQLSMAH